MHTVTSFHASAVEPHDVKAIMVEYVALERARIYRRLFVIRFGLLALVLAIVGFGLHWLPAFATGTSVGSCAVPPIWAWLAELRCDRRLARRLEQIPAASAQSNKKVIKSS